jgi:GntR family transcriptional repressor for pyruvate dehydrogenase complex
VSERPPLDSVFSVVRSQTAFEETVDRLGTAIKLGLLAPGTQLPPERELCSQLGIARSTLRQALTALTESGLLYAVRGRGGGTFVVDPLPPSTEPSSELLASWREACDSRLAVEFASAALAAERATPQALASIGELVEQLDDLLEDFESYRQADVRLHITLAEATGSERLVVAMTQAQGEMTDLIAHIPHPPEILSHANEQHVQLLGALREGNATRAVAIMADHLHGTEHVIAGLLRDA